jgi:hypothetical protein
MSTIWKLPQVLLSRLNDPSQRSFNMWNNAYVIDAIQIATTDGLVPFNSSDGTNIDLTETYIQINNVKYYFTLSQWLVNNYQYADESQNPPVLKVPITIENGKLKIEASGSEAGLINEDGALGIRGGAVSGVPKLFINFTDPATSTYNNMGIDLDSSYFLMEEVTGSSSGGGSGGGSGEGSGSGSGSGGGGSSSVSVTGAVVSAGKVIGSVSVDPRSTSVRVTINGVEQALPTGSVVRNTTTGQKFLKLAGGETEFAAISITPSSEWSWSAAGVASWSLLQGT